MYIKKTIATFFIVFTTLFFNSCKVNYSLSGASIPPEAKSVCIKHFNNNASLSPPGLSQSFTQALQDKISSQTRLTLVNSNADLNFEGQIVDYNTTPQAVQSNDQAALNRLTISVLVKYTCVYNEKKNYEQAFSRFADYESSKSLSQVESDLIDQINSQLVQDIFNKTFNDW